MKSNLVKLPTDFEAIKNGLSTPDFFSISKPKMWTVAFYYCNSSFNRNFLCIEAADKLDPEKKDTPTLI